jgi:hypothetical protein
MLDYSQSGFYGLARSNGTQENSSIMELAGTPLLENGAISQI